MSDDFVPRVSVVIPLYNKAPYIARAIASVQRQTVRDVELIVVDDGSTDGSSSVVESIEDSRKALIRQLNAGPGAARNRGLRDARAPFVAFLDADDAWAPSFLEEALRALQGASAEVSGITFGCDFIPNREGDVRRRRWARWGLSHGVHALKPTAPDTVVLALLEYFWPSATLLRTSAVRGAGGFYDQDGCRYAEDTHLFLKLLLNSKYIT